jgi:hypothetical protein
LALAGLVSCGDGRVDKILIPDPRPIEDLRITLTASPSSGHAGQPVTIVATLENRGRESVILLNECPDPMIRIYDEQSAELLQRDPTTPCPIGLKAPIQPGERASIPLTFEGLYYSDDGQSHEAPAGNYRSVAMIGYAVFQNYSAGEPRVLNREVTFTWQ